MKSAILFAYFLARQSSALFFPFLCSTLRSVLTQFSQFVQTAIGFNALGGDAIGVAAHEHVGEMGAVVDVVRNRFTPIAVGSIQILHMQKGEINLKLFLF
jgi:hypothetical protein